MPRIIDHDSKRREIIEITWRFIAQHGYDKLNLRDLAAAAGYANGGLKTYFATRDDILVATFQFVFDSTNRRIEKETQGLEGFAAVRAFAREVMPLDERRRDEARVVVHFWHMALQHRTFGELNARSMDDWRHRLDRWLGQELPEGQVRAARDGLMNFLMGTQSAAVLDPQVNTATSLQEQLDFIVQTLQRLAVERRG
ncbi:TetR/AcrR family transcriptional regulator [Glutamicibacter endophyticus]|uniref:TetR/AcrR family transcriptional regulator n=1 Tax=Glutamicibacter endophyticus TaxID=1522174 RepID=UPI003AEF198F